MSTEPDLSTIHIGQYVATWEPVACCSAFLGNRVAIRTQWIIRRGVEFIGYADFPADVAVLVRFHQNLPVRKAA